MKRVTLNQLASYEEGERGWFEHLVSQVYNGNHGHVKDDLRHMSKKETLIVIKTCANNLIEKEYSDSDYLHKQSIERLLNYASEILYERL